MRNAGLFSAFTALVVAFLLLICAPGYAQSPDDQKQKQAIVQELELLMQRQQADRSELDGVASEQVHMQAAMARSAQLMLNLKLEIDQQNEAMKGQLQKQQQEIQQLRERIEEIR